ncbi:TetR/AcrR family transcriptional regulator [Pendulispora albinea]|uniref:TetR/AcrR family transcriptional regulator n=1 Tax=Pendulispora albinea TaxID=2741071 RepID=A0ABZ2LTM2_9BACT
MNAKAVQKERTHNAILASASKLLRTRGIAGANIVDIMKGTGLTVGGFYAHFASKDALVADVLRQALGEMSALLFDGLEEDGSSERLKKMLRRYLTPKHRDNPEMGCPLPAVASELSTTAAVPEHRECLADELSKWAAEMGDRAPTVDQISPRHLGLALIAVMFGGLCLSRAVAGTRLSDEILRACKSFGQLGVAASLGERS